MSVSHIETENWTCYDIIILDVTMTNRSTSINKDPRQMVGVLFHLERRIIFLCRESYLQ